MDGEMVLGATPGVDPQVDLVLSEEPLLTRPCGHGLLKDRYSPRSDLILGQWRHLAQVLSRIPIGPAH